MLWGYLPRTTDVPVARVRSGQTVTIDTVSHEGLLEDQGRDPAAWFAGHGVPREQVLDDAVAVAAEYDRHHARLRRRRTARDHRAGARRGRPPR